jgi:hypothetical protein
MQVDIRHAYSEYTTIAKLILRASNRVNDRHILAPCAPDEALARCVDTSRLAGSRGEEVVMWSEDEADDGKPSHPLARSTAWWISQIQQHGFFWTGTHAERRGMGATACSRNDGFGIYKGLRHSNYAALRDKWNLAATKGSTSTFKQFCSFGLPNNGRAVFAYRVSRWASGEARLRNRSNAGTSDARDELRRMRSTHP